jgi:hypothetical protein
MTSDDAIANASLAERRRAIFSRVVGALAARGTPIDNDPKFVDLVNDWIDGKIEMADVVKGYTEIRRSARRGATALAKTGIPDEARKAQSNEDLLAELDQIIGIRELDDPLAT